MSKSCKSCEELCEQRKISALLQQTNDKKDEIIRILIESQKLITAKDIDIHKNRN